MASTGKCKLIKSPKRRRSLYRRRSRRRRLSKSSESSEQSESLRGSESSSGAESLEESDSESSEQSESRRGSDSSSDAESLEESDSESSKCCSSESPEGMVPLNLHKWPAIPGPDPPKPQKPSKWPELPYGRSSCRRCQELAKVKMVPMPDDHEYYDSDEDFYGDEELKLRIINYRRKKWLTGGFGADCLPKGYPSFNGVAHVHYAERHRKIIWKFVKSVINTYNQQTGKGLELFRIVNVTPDLGGFDVFYITFECFNPNADNDDTAAAENYVDTYQTVISTYIWKRGKEYEVHIFKKRTNGNDEHLFPPDPDYEKLSSVKI